MNLGQLSSEYSYADPYISLSPRDNGGYLFNLTQFGFGKTDVTNSSEYYEDLCNSSDEDYGLLANSTSFAMNFRGLGLPTKLFRKFSNLLAVLTKGESTCIDGTSGYCVLSSPCSHYADTGLWDYDFKIAFTSNGGSSFMRVPLATFAANSDLEGGLCAIFVEYLDDRSQSSQHIMFGGMFF